MSAVLLIAGTDSSGGAGLTRDVRTLTRFATRALCVVTAVTAQSDTQLEAVHVIPAKLVRAQMTAALATCRVDAIKVGTAHLVLIDGEEREPAATIAAVVTAVASWPAS